VNVLLFINLLSLWCSASKALNGISFSADADFALSQPSLLLNTFVLQKSGKFPFCFLHRYPIGHRPVMEIRLQKADFNGLKVRRRPGRERKGREYRIVGRPGNQMDFRGAHKQGRWIRLIYS
jgi:hypothetical protein